MPPKHSTNRHSKKRFLEDQFTKPSEDSNSDDLNAEARGSYTLFNIPGQEVCVFEKAFAGAWGTYHLHGKTGNSNRKIKWFAPFRLGSFRKYGLGFETKEGADAMTWIAFVVLSTKKEIKGRKGERC